MYIFSTASKATSTGKPIPASVGARPSPVMEFSPLPANVVMMLFVSTRRIRRLLESAK
jgi:hypothetical protein